MIVSIHEARTHLSALIERAAAGEEIIIAKRGKPMAVLGPLPVASPRRTPGAWKGRIKIAPDFDAPLPDDLLAAFEGDSNG